MRRDEPAAGGAPGPESIRKVLGWLGLSAEVPVVAGVRSPPRQGEMPTGAEWPV